MSVAGGHEDEDSFNMCLQNLSTQEEAGMVAESQLIPEVESKYVIVKVSGEKST